MSPDASRGSTRRHPPPFPCLASRSFDERGIAPHVLQYSSRGCAAATPPCKVSSEWCAEVALCWQDTREVGDPTLSKHPYRRVSCAVERWICGEVTRVSWSSARLEPRARSLSQRARSAVGARSKMRARTQNAFCDAGGEITIPCGAVCVAVACWLALFGWSLPIMMIPHPLENDGFLTPAASGGGGGSRCGLWLLKLSIIHT